MHKNTFRSVAALLMTLTLLVAAVPLAAVPAAAEETDIEDMVSFEEVTVGDFTFAVYDDGSAAVTAYSGSETEVSVPSAVDRYTVLAIGNEAFSGCTALKTVDMPKTLRMLGYGVFSQCASLARVDIPRDVVYIGENLFDGCNRYLSIHVYSNLVIPSRYTIPLSQSDTQNRDYSGYCYIGSACDYGMLQNGYTSNAINYMYTLFLQDGVWKYGQNSVQDENYTGLTYYYGTWYYVENGAINWNATTRCLYKDVWYYVKNGVLI